MEALEDASDSSSSSSEPTSSDSKKSFIKAFFFFLLKEVFFEEEEVGGETLEIGQASLTRRKSSEVKRVRGALGSKFWVVLEGKFWVVLEGKLRALGAWAKSLTFLTMLSIENLSHHLIYQCLSSLFSTMTYCHFRIQGILYFLRKWRMGEI
jgi:hypothetical protein